MIDINKLSLDIKGVLILPSATNPAIKKKWVFQGAGAQFANYRNHLGKPCMKRAYVKQTPSRTPAQAAQRNKMQAAVLAWRNISQNQLHEAKQIAEKRAISVYMAFVGLFMKAYQATTANAWDDNTSVWDTTPSIWDNNTATAWDSVLRSWDSTPSKWD